MVSVSEENVSGIDTHFRKYRIGGIDTFGIVSPSLMATTDLPDMYTCGPRALGIISGKSLVPLLQ